MRLPRGAFSEEISHDARYHVADHRAARLAGGILARRLLGGARPLHRLDLRPNTPWRDLAESLLESRPARDHQLDLRVEAGIVSVAQTQEGLADDVLEDLSFCLGRLAGMGERLLKLQQVLCHL